MGNVLPSIVNQPDILDTENSEMLMSLQNNKSFRQGQNTCESEIVLFFFLN